MTEEKPKNERSEKQKAQFAAAQQLAYKKRKVAAEAKKAVAEPLEEKKEPTPPPSPQPTEPPTPEPEPEPEPRSLRYEGGHMMFYE